MDTLLSVAPNGTHPQPITLAKRVRWIVCDLPDYTDDAGHGFAVKLHVNPTYGKLRAEREALREPGDDPYFKATADRVLAWTALAEGEDGTVVPIPSPAESGYLAFHALEEPLVTWVLHQLMTAHHPKVTPPSETISTPAGPRDEPPPPEEA